MKVVVKKTIRVNGKEYQSVEELPAEVRATYERALSGESCAPTVGTSETGATSAVSSAQGTSPQAATARASVQFRISYGGREYTRVEDLPFAVRKLYEAVTGVLGGRIDTSGPAATSPSEGAGTNAATGARPGGASFNPISVSPQGRIDPMLLPSEPERIEAFPSGRGLRRPVVWIGLGLAALLTLWALGSLITQH